MAPVIIKLNKLTTILQLVTAVLIHLPALLDYIWHHWTVVGSLSAEADSLRKFPGRIDHIIAHHAIAKPPLSHESQAKVPGFKWRLAESSISVLGQKVKFRGSWFLFWRSQEAREELADLYRKIERLKADIRSVEMEILKLIELRSSAKPVGQLDLSDE